MKKIICAFMVVIIGIVAFIYFDPLDMFFNKGELDSMDEDIIAINDYYGDVLFYGQNIGFRDSLKVDKYIDSLDETSFKDISSDKDNWLIIVDCEGKLNISDDEFKVIRRLMDEKKLSLGYIGSQYISKINEIICDNDEKMSFGENKFSAFIQVRHDGTFFCERDTVTKEDYDINKKYTGEDNSNLQQIILIALAHDIKDY